MDEVTVSWKELTELTRGEAFRVERVRMKRTGIAVEGQFELPALAQMTEADQVFIAAFLRSHGSIKEMERLFGISYPTVKARLVRVAEQLPFVETLVSGEDVSGPAEASQTSRKEILDRVARGELDAAQAAKLLREQTE